MVNVYLYSDPHESFCLPGSSFGVETVGFAPCGEDELRTRRSQLPMGKLTDSTPLSQAQMSLGTTDKFKLYVAAFQANWKPTAHCK